MDFYKTEVTWGLEEALKPRTIGGMTLVKTRVINNQNIDEMVWPRTCFTAETLWANPENKDTSEPIRYRFKDDIVCRLEYVGVRTSGVYLGEACF